MCMVVYCSFIYSSDFGKMVAREYLNFFEFADQNLVECLRQFLGSVSLSGETYDRERIMMHYSEKYFEHNPYSFPSYGREHVNNCNACKNNLCFTVLHVCTVCTLYRRI